MRPTLIKNAQVVNEGSIVEADVRLKDGKIEQIAGNLNHQANEELVDAQGCWLMPGMIDDQVHFREPGLTHKGTIASESAAAVAGGITSFMEMPNVSPSTTTIEALEQKKAIAAQRSTGNYGFYLGATEDNLDQIKAIDPTNVCGVKVFMGASTGDLLVEHPQALEGIFRESPVLIVTHCEYGPVIKQNLETITAAGREPVIQDHPIIRDTQACYESSSYAVDLAKRHNSDLHVLHITTAKELELFQAGPTEGKKITAEACVHHLWFCDQDYQDKGNLIKCNPAIKTAQDRAALREALLSNQIDIVATDHAPHTWQEKQQAYPQAPAGLPLVQHALLSLIDLVKQGVLSIEQVVQKTAHHPALRYKVQNRGYIREGYAADLVLVDPNAPTQALHENTKYLCQWTPFNNHTFSASIQSTWVNGQQMFDGKQILTNTSAAQALVFER